MVHQRLGLIEGEQLHNHLVIGVHKPLSDLNDEVAPLNVMSLAFEEWPEIVILQLLEEHLHDGMIISNLIHDRLPMHLSERKLLTLINQIL